MSDDLVKPLEWGGQSGRFAENPWGGYNIIGAPGPDGTWDWFSWSHSSRGDSDESDLAFPTEDAAKAAAQADYADRIMAAIDAHYVAELVEAARKAERIIRNGQPDKMSDAADVLAAALTALSEQNAALRALGGDA